MQRFNKTGVGESDLSYKADRCTEQLKKTFDKVIFLKDREDNFKFYQHFPQS